VYVRPEWHTLSREQPVVIYSRRDADVAIGTTSAFQDAVFNAKLEYGVMSQENGFVVSFDYDMTFNYIIC
jgi:hypothetical protein